MPGFFARFRQDYAQDLQWDYEGQASLSLSGHEWAQGLANRFLYSTAYKVFYFVLAALSLICLIVSLWQPCATGGLIVMEVLINVALVLEVGLRIFVQGRMYFTFMANIIDAVLVVFCVLTLVLLNHNECTTGAEFEEMLDTLFLVLRNSVQFIRLLAMMRKGQSMETRRNFLNLDEANLGDMDVEAGAFIHADS